MSPDGAMNCDMPSTATGSYSLADLHVDMPRPSLECGVSAPLQLPTKRDLPLLSPLSRLRAEGNSSSGGTERHTARGMPLLECEHESGPVHGTVTTLQPFVMSFCGWPEPLAATVLQISILLINVNPALPVHVPAR